MTYNKCTVRLKKIHRQAEQSGILSDANNIRRAINPVAGIDENKIITGTLQDMHYFFDDDKEKLHRVIFNTFIQQVEREGIENVFIIVPRKKDCINSTETFNKEIQDYLLKDRVEYEKNGRIYREGARVIQKKNDYKRDVVNGEVGFIETIDQDEEYMMVKFPDKMVMYEFDEIKQLQLAYALTVHSFQGSQAPIIIIGLDYSHYILLDACLTYTAITRAEKRTYMFAEKKAFEQAVRTNKNYSRNTIMKYMFKNSIEANLDTEAPF